PFVADGDTVMGLLGVWSNLRADRFAAYGPKADAAKFGLDKPERTVTVTVQSAAGVDGKKPADATHTLALGKPVESALSQRYARLDNGPGIVVLDATTVAELSHPYLDYVNRSLLKFDPSAVAAVQRRMGNETVELVKRDDGWRLTKPADLQADEPSLQKLLEQLANLRAARIAAYPAGDLKSFGLDAPAALVTVKLTGAAGKAPEHVVKIGKPTPDAPGGERFAQIDNGPAVAVLPAALAQRLLADPISFR